MPSHGQCCTYGRKTTLKLLLHVLAIMANSYFKIVFSLKSGVNPLKNKLTGVISVELTQKHKVFTFLSFRAETWPTCKCRKHVLFLKLARIFRKFFSYSHDGLTNRIPHH